MEGFTRVKGFNDGPTPFLVQDGGIFGYKAVLCEVVGGKPRKVGNVLAHRSGKWVDLESYRFFDECHEACDFMACRYANVQLRKVKGFEDMSFLGWQNGADTLCQESEAICKGNVIVDVGEFYADKPAFTAMLEMVEAFGKGATPLFSDDGHVQGYIQGAPEHGYTCMYTDCDDACTYMEYKQENGELELD